jgi:hypothetical protein
MNVLVVDRLLLKLTRHSYSKTFASGGFHKWKKKSLLGYVKPSLLLYCIFFVSALNIK